MIFTGLCIYLIIGIILFMSDTVARESINDCIKEASSLRVVIIFSVIVLMFWLPLLIYAKFSEFHEEDEKNGESK